MRLESWVFCNLQKQVPCINTGLGPPLFSSLFQGSWHSHYPSDNHALIVNAAVGLPLHHKSAHPSRRGPPGAQGMQSIFSNSNHSSIDSYPTPHPALWCGQVPRRTSWWQGGDLSADISPDITWGIPTSNSWATGSTLQFAYLRSALSPLSSPVEMVTDDELVCYLPDKCVPGFVDRFPFSVHGERRS